MLIIGAGASEVARASGRVQCFRAEQVAAVDEVQRLAMQWRLRPPLDEDVRYLLRLSHDNMVRSCEVGKKIHGFYRSWGMGFYEGELRERVDEWWRCVELGVSLDDALDSWALPVEIGVTWGLRAGVVVDSFVGGGVGRLVRRDLGSAGSSRVLELRDEAAEGGAQNLSTDALVRMLVGYVRASYAANRGMWEVIANPSILQGVQ